MAKRHLWKFLIVIGLSILAITACNNDTQTSSGSTTTTVCNPTYIETGKKYIGEGKYNDALAYFQKALKTNEECTDARWGIIVANFEIFIGNVNKILFFGSGGAPAFAPEGLQTLLASFLASIEDPLRAIYEQIPFVEKSNSDFTLESIPFLFGPSSNPYIKMTLQGKLSTTEIELIKSLTTAILGTIDFVWAHDFDIEVTDFPFPNTMDAEFDNFFYLRDGIANIYSDYPNFLGKGLQWDIRMPRVDNEYADSVTGLYSFLMNLPGNDPTPSPESTLILYEDTDGNGIDGGDVIGINVRSIEKFSIPVSGFSTPDDNPDFYKELLTHYSIPYPFTTTFMQYLYQFLLDLYDSFKAVDEGGSGKEIHPYKLINSLIEGIGFLTIKEVPDFFAINPTKFFSNPHPIKDYLPRLIDFPGGFSTWPDTEYSFLIEVEFGREITSTEIKLFYQGDVTHFTEEFTLNGRALDISSIPPDCIFNEDGTVYPYWNDPSFNGMLLLNVKNLFGETCQWDPDGWLPGTNYTLDKVLNGLGEALQIEDNINQISP